MKKVPVFSSLLLFITSFLPANGQILSKPDPDASFDRSKGIIVLQAANKGSFFLDDYLITGLKEHDTLYIINVPCGQHNAKVISDSSAPVYSFILSRRKVLEINAGKNALQIMESRSSYDDIAEKVKGKTVYFISRRHYFNITQTSFVTLQAGSSEYNPGMWFRSISTINGYQIAPGFCIGAGISYNNYDIPVVFGYAYYADPQCSQLAVLKNVSFLPVYFDVRAHFSGKRVAPFIKFDIGYNILISKKSMQVYNYGYYPSPENHPYTFTLTGGGVYLSPGIGVRVAINKLIQVIFTAEYTYDSSKSTMASDGEQNESVSGYRKKLHCFKFNIGIGFQK